MKQERINHTLLYFKPNSPLHAENEIAVSIPHEIVNEARDIERRAAVIKNGRTRG